jgi:hypothetical protein
MSAIDCGGRPFWTGSMDVPGDGEYRSPAITVEKPGVYAFRETVAGSEVVAATTTRCAIVAETSLVAPAILAGRGDRAGQVTPAAAVRRAPVRVRIPALGIDAAVSPAGIDLKKGALGIPRALQRLGWWRDGSTPAAASGATLIAGHVDAADSGIGALFSLHRAGVGDSVEVTTGDGKTRSYRVASLRTYAKRGLPLSIYSRKGSPRLVLVTCGGPFDEATGHYRDNIVLTATPA